MAGPSVLFVCTANICRSPMAMALFRYALGEAAAGWRVESAGTWARPGYAAAPLATQVMAERGIDLTAHRSRPVSRELLRDFHLILTMETGQKEALQVEFPEAARRVFLLSEMAGQSGDVYDPIGGPLREFRSAARELERLLAQGQARILALATGEPDNPT